MSQSFLQRLIESCEARPEKVAMRIVGDQSEVYTYGETLRQIRAVAYRLDQEGIEFGDRVALIGENHPSWAIAYLAILYHGAICVPLDPNGEIETLTNFMENSAAKLAFIGSEIVDKFRGIEERLGQKIPTVMWNLSEPVAVATGSDFAGWTTTEFPDSFRSEPPKAINSDTALLIYTSGTTGTPKGVPLSHGNIAAELDGIDEVLHLSEKEKILSLLPLFHAYLQIVNLWAATTHGCEVGYLKELSPAELGSAMKTFKPTILTTVPRLWYLFHKKIFDAIEEKPRAIQILFRILLATNGFLRDHLKTNLGRKFFSQVHDSFGGDLRIAISAGSRFDEDVAIDFHKLGFTILQGYGLTETSGAATATHETDNRVGSVGKPMKGAQIKIDCPDNDGVGEVLIKGGIVFDGYYRNPQATAEAFTDDGWFRSGDLGKFDNDGHLYIVGRAKDVIVLPSGKNVHPEDLEVHYLKTPLVEEMAIIGVRDASEQRVGAEKLAAVVVPDFEYLRREKVANSKEAIRYALDNLGRDLPEYQRVRDYIIRADALPRTATRKIKRFELKKEFESGRLGGETQQPKQWQITREDKELLQTKTAAAVVSAIRKNAKEAEIIHPEMNLEIDLGLDSLARAETFAALEHAFRTEFDGDAAAKALTVRDVFELVDVSSSSNNGIGDIDPDNETLTEDLNWAKILNESDGEFPELQPVLKKRPFFTPFAFTVYRTFNLFCRVFMSLEVQNIEELKKMKRPFLICPNHQSYLDPFVLCSNYSYEHFSNTFHVGASMFFRGRFMAWVARMLHVVPVDPDTQLMRAMRAGAIGLKNGKILNIYPEGERAYDGDLHQFKKGAAILATELDLPILPVAMDGLHKVWARSTWRIRPAKVKVRFGKAFYARDVQSPSPSGSTPHQSSLANDRSGSSAALSPSSDAKYAAVTEHLRRTIAVMIDEMRR
jgi:long-chain acyl-CoA synthetase